MAFKVFQKSMAPSVGRKISVPAVAVAGNGRMLCTSAASIALSGCGAASIAYDEDTRQVMLTGIAVIPKGKEDYYFSITRGKKAPQAGVSAAGFLGTVGYDFKAAGNQVYSATINAAKHQVSFSLPAMTPAAKPKQARRTKSKANGTAAPVEQAPAAPGEFATT